jgi:hypothetical protein
MKRKYGFLCLALVLALGTMGIGYAAWTDTIFINGSVSTGSVCLEIEEGTYGEINTCPPSDFAVLPDRNWYGWIEQIGGISCPPGYKFEDKPCSDKDVAYATMTPVLDGNGHIVELVVTIYNAYPHYLSHLTFEVCNCGTVPIKIKAPTINQSPFLLIEYRNGVGTQLEPGECHEISLFVGVVQHEGYWDNDVWVVDDPRMPLTPMETPLSFTIDVEAIQWDEY